MDLNRPIKSVIGSQVVLKDNTIELMANTFSMEFLRGVRGTVIDVDRSDDSVMTTLYRISFDNQMSTALPVPGWGLEWLSVPPLKPEQPAGRLGELISTLDRHNVGVDNANSFPIWVKEEVLAILAEKDQEIQELKNQIANVEIGLQTYKALSDGLKKALENGGKNEGK
jgi:hypothetical protein